MKFTSLTMMLVLTTTISYCQNETKKRNSDSGITLGGQMMISGNAQNLFYNMGGGGISLSSNKISLSVNFLPSLRYNFETTKITPVLGVGPQLKLKERILIGVPVYYLENNWTASIGIGFKFLHPCAQ